MNWAAFGDSNTRYWLWDQGIPGPLEQAWPALLEKSLRAQGRGDTVRNLGCPGGEMADARRAFAAQTAGAEGVILAFGTNDIKRPEATLEAYLSDLADILEENGPRPLLVLSILWFDYGYGFAGSQARLPVWNKAAAELCQRRGAAFWDTTARFSGRVEWYNDHPPHHLNAVGQEEMAQAVLEGLKQHQLV